MTEINRRRFLVGIGIIATVATTSGISISRTLLVEHIDHGLATAVDTQGNSFDAYISEFRWNGKSALSYVDKALTDLCGDIEGFRTQENMALIEQIAESEGRALKDISVVIAGAEPIPLDSLRAA